MIRPAILLSGSQRPAKRPIGARTGAVLRLTLLVLLLVFVIVCGVHVGGLHHDGDAHALGMAIAITSALALALAAGLSGLSAALNQAGPGGRLAATYALADAIDPGVPGPLRC